MLTRVPEKYQPKHIGVFILRQIGDVLLATPVLEELRRRYPEARITVLANDFTTPVLENNPHVDDLLVYRRGLRKEGVWRRLQHEWKLCQEIRRAGFDLVIDLTSGDRPALYAWLSRAGTRIGFAPTAKAKNFWKPLAYTCAVPRPRERMHQCDRHFRILEPLGITRAASSLPRLYVSEAELEYARKEQAAMGGETAVAHFTSSWMFKCWEDAKAAAVIDWLASSLNLRVWFSCGTDDRELKRADAILRLCQSHPKPCFGTLSLRQLAALIAVSRVFVGVDTGPMHMAAAIGIPTVAIFGPTGSALWAPLSENALVIKGECPCQDHGSKECDWSQTRACLKAISVEEVTSGITRLLSRQKDRVLA